MLQATDKNSARSMTKTLSKKKHAGWLFINIGPLIALITVLATFSLWAIILLGHTKGVNENVLFALFGGLNTALGFILSYYFGSSEGDTTIETHPTVEPIPTSAEPTPLPTLDPNDPDLKLLEENLSKK